MVLFSQALTVTPHISMAAPTTSTNTPCAQRAIHSQVTFEPLRVFEVFSGEAYEDVKDWLNQFERVAMVNRWSLQDKLGRAYFAIESSACTW